MSEVLTTEDTSINTFGGVKRKKNPLRQWIEKQLVPKKIRETVHRGGKTFQRTRTIMVNPEDEIPEWYRKQIDNLNKITGMNLTQEELESIKKIPKRYLYALIHSNNVDVRRIVANRIDRKYLREFIDDDNLLIVDAVARRSPEIALEVCDVLKINPNYVYVWDIQKAKKKIKESKYFDDYEKDTLIESLEGRLSDLKSYGISIEDIKSFHDTGEIKNFGRLESEAFSALSEKYLSERIRDFVDNFLYYGDERTIHTQIRQSWIDSSNNDLPLILKESVRRIFETNDIIHHDEIFDYAKKQDEILGDTGYDVNDVDTYVKRQYGLTQQLLKTTYSEDDAITIYRGTSSRELKDLKKGDSVEINQNPISSWSTDVDVADGFAIGKRSHGKIGATLMAKVPISEIFSSFLTHGTGDESEMMIVGRKGRKAYAESIYKP